MEQKLKINSKENEIFATTCHGTFRIAKVDNDIDPHFKSEIINYIASMVEVKNALEALRQVNEKVLANNEALKNEADKP